MIERLANVLYWMACGIAGLVQLGTLVIAATVTSKWDSVGVIALGAVMASLAYLAGRAIRYVLVGR
jgi:hypothetical protein